MESPAHRAAILIDSRRFAEALDVLQAAGEEDLSGQDRQAMRRHCLARLGRLTEAAEAGRLVARAGDRPEDSARLARILLDAGQVAEAAEFAARAIVLTAPDDRATALEPLVECLLRAPESWSGIASTLHGLGLDPDGSPAIPEPAAVREPCLYVPLGLPWYRRIDHDHPAHMKLIERLDSVAVRMPGAGDWPGLAGFPRALRRAKAAFEHLMTGEHLMTPPEPIIPEPIIRGPIIRGPIIRRWAARFVAARFTALLDPAPPGALHFVMGEPLCVGDADWVYWFDQLISVFQPVRMFEQTRITPRHAPDWWFMRALLTGRRCHAVFSHLRRTAGDLGSFFRAPPLAGKTHHVRSYDGASPIRTDPSPRPGNRDFAAPLRILFASSRTPRPSTFFYRGGVDALAVFRRYREMGGTGRLFVRSPLPPHLDSGWLGHARAGQIQEEDVTVLDGALPYEALCALRDSCHVALLPAALVFRASLIESLAAGLPVLGYRIPGIEELVQDNTTGFLTERQPPTFDLDPAAASFSFDAMPLFTATMGPLDAQACQRLAEALLALDHDRDRLARMSAAARAAAAGVMHGAADQDLFNRVIAERAQAAFRRMQGRNQETEPTPGGKEVRDE